MASVPRVDPYLEGVVAKLLDRFANLEKKVDIVIAQTSGRPVGTSHQPNQAPPPPPRRDRTLYEAICADCHKVCEVPFRPSEDRPVYCKECFAKRKSGNNSGPNFPVLTPVAMPTKTSGSPSATTPSIPPAAPAVSKKEKKGQPAKKAKKKK